MSKMHKKFLASIALVFLLVIGVSIFLYSNIISRYFLYTEVQDLKNTSNAIMKNNDFTYSDIKDAEDELNVSIISIAGNLDENAINNELKSQLSGKGIVLDRYWLWEEDYHAIMDGDTVSRRYPQDDLGYHFLAEYRLYENNIILIGRIIPMDNDVVMFSNVATTLILLVAGVMLYIIVSYLVHRITKPIAEIREVTKSISNSDFKTVEVRTGDELQMLADDVSIMSGKLKRTYSELELKNKQMSDLLSNVSHELKTPVSLIKMYSCGIRDGLDDGSFLDTIMMQNSRMEELIQKLLSLTKYETQSIATQNINASEILVGIINEFRLSDIVFNCDIVEDLEITINIDHINQIFSNVISNAVKYSEDKHIDVMLQDNDSYVSFSVSNYIDSKTVEKIEIDKIWDAFYVAEESRNSNLSGTGLGLALVKVICEKNKIKYSCELDEKIISFKFIFVKPM